MVDAREDEVFGLCVLELVVLDDVLLFYDLHGVELPRAVLFFAEDHLPMRALPDQSQELEVVDCDQRLRGRKQRLRPFSAILALFLLLLLNADEPLVVQLFAECLGWANHSSIFKIFVSGYVDIQVDILDGVYS